MALFLAPLLMSFLSLSAWQKNSEMEEMLYVHIIFSRLSLLWYQARVPHLLFPHQKKS